MMQRTIRNTVDTRGVGIHSGNSVTLTLAPAGSDEGVGFIREDLNARLRVPAHFSRVRNTQLATTLTDDGVSIATVEHLTASLLALGVDNVTIALSGPEVPILDGSAEPFVSLIRSAGISEGSAPRKGARIVGPITVTSGDCRAELRPGPDHLHLDYTIVYENPHIGTQRFSFDLTADAFAREVAPARTFGLFNDINGMYAQGLALGGSLENAVVIGDDGVMNPEGLRFDDECVRHKCLDAIGDLSLFGMPILGDFIAYKSGHRLNHLLVQELFRQQAYEIIPL
ncbi:MAG: UDP-3-O-acyl-N-acetylglucosamine deacetylase [Deltaproteobacteria bacterium]|nr:UDP-3-O-acyl-N-acetylglucosamine deacetylase [Candidatus Zymogenaceae bacterium]